MLVKCHGEFQAQHSNTSVGDFFVCPHCASKGDQIQSLTLFIIALFQ